MFTFRNVKQNGNAAFKNKLLTVDDITVFDSILLSIIMKMIQNCGAYQLLLASSCCTRGVANVVVDKEWKGNSRNAQDHEIIAKNAGGEDAAVGSQGRGPRKRCWRSNPAHHRPENR